PGWSALYAAMEIPPVPAGEAGKWRVNGLAVAPDGTMYAYARFRVYPTGEASEFYNEIRLLVKEPGGPWRWLDESSSPRSYTYSHNVTSGAVAGTFDPVSG